MRYTTPTWIQYPIIILYRGMLGGSTYLYVVTDSQLIVVFVEVIGRLKMMAFWGVITLTGLHKETPQHSSKAAQLQW